MKLLKRVRNLKLDNKMLKCTEFPRTLIWVSSRISEAEDEQSKKLNKMVKYLTKEWR